MSLYRRKDDKTARNILQTLAYAYISCKRLKAYGKSNPLGRGLHLKVININKYVGGVLDSVADQKMVDQSFDLAISFVCFSASIRALTRL